jgi:acetyltransferase-like isoleucine patch superfamily enzyme
MKKRNHDRFEKLGVVIVNSEVDENSEIFGNVRIVDSDIHAGASVGDNSIIKSSFIDRYVSIHRNNTVHASKIEKHSYTGPNTIVLHASIGSFCSISWNVSIGGANHDYERFTTHSFLYNKNSILNPGVESYNRFQNKCIVGHDVWIAANAVILRGITVGTGSIIAANAVVTKDVPPYAIVAGNPAKVLKYRFSDSIIDELLTLEWWSLSDNTIKKIFKLLASKTNINTLEQIKNKLKNDSI